MESDQQPSIPLDFADWEITLIEEAMVVELRRKADSQPAPNLQRPKLAFQLSRPSCPA
jgi:hypothetical protein